MEQDRPAEPPPILNAPPVVTTLIAALLIAFAALSLMPDRLAARIEYAGAVSPLRFVSALQHPLDLPLNIASLGAHALFHAGLAHLGLNCLWLLAFGAPVARRMAFEARSARRSALVFTIFFFLCSAAGALAYVALHPRDPTLLIGASGGVSGLLGGLVRFAFRRRVTSLSDALAFSPISDRAVLAWSAVIIGTNLAIGVFGAALSGGVASAIAWEAHIGGYLFGLFAFPRAVRAANR